MNKSKESAIKVRWIPSETTDLEKTKEAITQLVRLLARQAAREDFKNQISRRV